MHGVYIYPSPPRELWKREGAIDQALLSAKDQLSKAERNRVMGIGKVRTITHTHTLAWWGGEPTTHSITHYFYII